MLLQKPTKRKNTPVAEAVLPKCDGTEDTIKTIMGVMSIPAPTPCINNGIINVGASACVANKKYIQTWKTSNIKNPNIQIKRMGLCKTINLEETNILRIIPAILGIIV